MKTKVLIEYDDETDTIKVRAVQGAKFGDAQTEITVAEKNQFKASAKKIHAAYKEKPNPQDGRVN